MSGVRAAKKARTRASLMASALHLAEQKGGLASVGLREITSEVGITPAAFYRHFANLDELGTTLVTESAETLLEHLSASEPTAGTSDYWRLDALIAWLEVHPAEARFFASGHVGGTPRMRAATTEQLARFTSVVARNLDRPGFAALTDDERRQTAELLVHVALEGVTALEQIGRDGLAFRLQLVLEGARALSGKRPPLR